MNSITFTVGVICLVTGFAVGMIVKHLQDSKVINEIMDAYEKIILINKAKFTKEIKRLHKLNAKLQAMRALQQGKPIIVKEEANVEFLDVNNLPNGFASPLDFEGDF